MAYKEPSNDEEQEIIRLCKRFEDERSRRRNWDDQWEEIALYTLPGKADFITERSKGDRSRQRQIYDPTAAVSNHTLASHMHSAMTSPSAPWFELQYRNPDNNKNVDTKEWIEDCTKRMFNAINESNFVSAINELYQDLCAFGTAAIEVSHINDPAAGFQIVFRSVPLGSIVFFENVFGRVDTVMHEVKLTPRQAYQQFGEENLPESIREKYKQDPDRECNFLRIVRPNQNYDPEKELMEENRMFESIWTYEKKPLTRNGFFELPYMVPRWSKMTTEQYGFGPGLLALPDTETLNEAKRLELRSWEKAIDPPMMGMSGGVVGDLHLEAGGFTSVRDTRAIAPLHDQANWQAVQIKSEETRKSIQAVYLIDQLILPERPNATATEVQIRYEMMQRVLGPTMGRLQAELLNPLVQRIFGIMSRNRQLQELPEGLEDGDYEVKYTGPLAKAQTANEAVAVERLINMLMATAQMDPSVMDVLDLGKAVQAVARQWGVPAEVLRSETEIKKLQEGRQQQQQQQQAAEQAMMTDQVDQSGAETTMAQVAAMEQMNKAGGIM